MNWKKKTSPTLINFFNAEESIYHNKFYTFTYTHLCLDSQKHPEEFVACRMMKTLLISLMEIVDINAFLGDRPTVYYNVDVRLVHNNFVITILEDIDGFYVSYRLLSYKKLVSLVEEINKKGIFKIQNCKIRKDKFFFKILSTSEEDFRKAFTLTKLYNMDLNFIG